MTGSDADYENVNPHGYTCSKCGELFTECELRDGSYGSPVDIREEFTCPNGHTGVKNYGYDGYLSQQWGIRESPSEVAR